MKKEAGRSGREGGRRRRKKEEGRRREGGNGREQRSEPDKRDKPDNAGRHEIREERETKRRGPDRNRQAGNALCSTAPRRKPG